MSSKSDFDAEVRGLLRTFFFAPPRQLPTTADGRNRHQANWSSRDLENLAEWTTGSDFRDVPTNQPPR